MKRFKKRPLAGCVALAIFSLSTTSALAVDSFWLGNSDFFDIGGQWSTGFPPGPADNAFFESPGNYQVFWDGVTGNGQQSGDLTVRNGAAEFLGQGDRYTYTLNGNGLIDDGGELRVSSMFLDFVAGNLNVGQNSNGALHIESDSIVKVQSLAVGTASVATVNNAALVLDNPGPSSVSTTGGGLLFTGGAHIESLNPDAQIFVAGGALTIEDDSTVIGFQSLTTQGDFANPGVPSQLIIDGFNTVVNLDANSPVGFTGLSVGFGGDSIAEIRNGATVNIGESGMAGIPSGFVVGSDIPAAIGGPLPGQSELIVDGFNTAIDVTGMDIQGAVGTSSPGVAFFEALGVPGVDNPPANGRLVVSDGAAVRLNASPGGYARIIVADQIGSEGAVEIRQGGLINAGNVFALGTDDTGVSGGFATLDIFDNGRLLAEQTFIGIDAEATIDGPGASLESAADAASLTVDGHLTIRSAGAVRFTGSGSSVHINERLDVQSTGMIELGENGQFLINDANAHFQGGHLNFTGSNGGITATDGELFIDSGAQITNAATLLTQGDNARVVIAGPGTNVSLAALAPTPFVGLTIGFGGRTEMDIIDGAVVDVDDSGTATPVGFGVGATVPDAIGGSSFGNSTLRVTGPGSRLEVTGVTVGASVGSSTGIADFFTAIGIPGVDNPPASGEMFIENGGAVVLNETPGGFSQLIVADTQGSFGDLRVSTGGLLDSGNLLQLGVGLVDEFGSPLPGGLAQLLVESGGTAQADQVILGADANVAVNGPGSSVTSNADNGSIQVNDGMFTVNDGGAINFNGMNSSLSVGSGLLDLRTGSSVNFADSGNIFTGPGSVTVDNASVLYNGAGTGGISTNGGQVRIQNNSQIIGAQSIASQGEGGQVIIDGAGTFVDLSGQTADNFTGISAGLGGNNSLSITNGAQVFIGESGLPGFASGFGAGSDLPALLGGPLGGHSTFTVDGPGSSLLVQGSNIGGGVGSGSALADFLEILIGVPVENGGGSGSLFVTNGAQVILDETPGGQSALIVADSANANGQVHVHGNGALLDAGQLFAVGVDELGNTAGQGLVHIGLGGRVQTDELVIGGNSSVQIWGGTLALESLDAAPGTFQFDFGTLEINGPNLFIGVGGFLGNVLTSEVDKNIVVANDAFVDTGAVLRLEADTFSANRIINNGDVEAAGPKVASNVAILENFGRVVGNGRVGAELDNAAGGEVRILSGQELAFQAANNINAGEINILGGSAQFDGTLQNLAGGFIGGRGVLATDGLSSEGVVAFSADSDILGDVSLFGGGQIIASGASVLTLFDDVDHNGAEIRASAGSSVVILGAYTGAGALTGGGDFFLEGDLNPGNSPGLMVVDGDLNFGALLDTTMEIGGLARGLEYDAIDVSGELTLGGILDIVLYDNGGGLFAPQEGNSFNLFSAGGINGSFLGINLPALQAGLRWDISLLESSGVLNVAAVPIPPALWLFGGALAALLRRRQLA